MKAWANWSVSMDILLTYCSLISVSSLSYWDIFCSCSNLLSSLLTYSINSFSWLNVYIAFCELRCSRLLSWVCLASSSSYAYLCAASYFLSYDSSFLVYWVDISSSIVISSAFCLCLSQFSFTCWICTFWSYNCLYVSRVNFSIESEISFYFWACNLCCSCW